MLHDGPAETSLGAGYANRECKPDYETMIKQARARLEKTEKFLEAVFEYKGPTSLRGKMAELVGELESERRQYVAGIDELIRRQEADSD